jgi:CHASE3 domain sensor protein
MRVDQTENQRTEPADPEPNSAEWWQARSATELREIIKHGFRLGSAYDGAIAETERRAREATRRLRDQALAESRKRARNRAAVLAAAFVIFAMALLWLWMS